MTDPVSEIDPHVLPLSGPGGVLGVYGYPRSFFIQV